MQLQQDMEVHNHHDWLAGRLVGESSWVLSFVVGTIPNPALPAFLTSHGRMGGWLQHHYQWTSSRAVTDTVTGSSSTQVGGSTYGTVPGSCIMGYDRAELGAE